MKKLAHLPGGRTASYIAHELAEKAGDLEHLVIIKCIRDGGYSVDWSKQPSDRLAFSLLLFLSDLLESLSVDQSEENPEEDA